MIEGEWNIENAVELTEEAKRFWFNNNSYTNKFGHKGFGFNKLNPCCNFNILKTFFRNGLILVLLNSLLKTIPLKNNEKFSK
jgi:hypothetical protein